MRITAIVCTHNRAPILHHCLVSLGRQTLPRDAFEVIVVDNASTDNTREVASKAGLDNLRYVYEERLGLSHARNRGLAEARSPYVAYIDDDARAEEHWLERILDRFDTLHPKPISVGGPILPWYRTPKPRWFRDEYEVASWGNAPRYLNPKVENFHGSNMVWRTDVLQGLAGFSPELGMKGGSIVLGEEREVYRRLAANCGEQNVFFYDPNIVVYHLVPAEKMTLPYRWRRAYGVGITSVRFARIAGTQTPDLCVGIVELLRRSIREVGRALYDMLMGQPAWEETVLSRGIRVARALGVFVESRLRAES